MAVNKMFMLLLLVGISSSVTYSKSISSAPSFCNGLDCPEFTIEKTEKDYEIRMYPGSVWASTEVLGMDYDKATSEGFDRLFNYIGGHNELNKKIAMTAPVATRVIPGPGPACESNFTISFFVPFAYQSNPPKPTASDVFISTLPMHEAYVRSFPGFAGEKEYLKEAAALGESLVNVTSSYHKDFYYTAGYDSPFRPFNRHNEVWFFKM